MCVCVWQEPRAENPSGSRSRCDITDMPAPRTRREHVIYARVWGANENYGYQNPFTRLKIFSSTNLHGSRTQHGSLDLMRWHSDVRLPGRESIQRLHWASSLICPLVEIEHLHFGFIWRFIGFIFLVAKKDCECTESGSAYTAHHTPCMHFRISEMVSAMVCTAHVCIAYAACTR